MFRRVCGAAPRIGERGARLIAASVASLAVCILASRAARAQQATGPAVSPADPIVLPTLSVTAPRLSIGGYLVSESTTALRLPAPIQDVPVAVQVVPQELIRDRQALTVRQALDTVSGVESSNAIPGSLAVRVRGFVDSGSSLRDGFRETSNQQDVQGVERIEVLKGPSSVLYGGSLSSGGVVNIVTKAPDDGAFVRGSLIGGSFGLFRATADINQDLRGDGAAVLRLNGAYDRTDTYRKFGYTADIFLNPTLRLRPTERDEILVRLHYLHTDFSYGPYQTPIAKPVLSLPLSFNFDDPTLGQSHKDAERAGYDWVHTFETGLRFRSGFNASLVGYDLGSDRLAVSSLAANGRTLSRTATKGPQLIQDYDLQNELSGDFDTGPIRHQWLAGTEAYQSTNDATSYLSTLPALDLLNPVYGISSGPFRLNSKTSARFGDVAAYLQDFVTLIPEVKLLVGGRYDVTNTISNNLVTAARSSNAAGKFSPRIGLTVEPVPNTALYVNWANSFIPTTATTSAGSALAPSSSEQFEVGIKQQLLGKRIQGTLALFQITRANVPTPDPANTLFSIASGEQRSRGVEIDMAGKILPGWNNVASYAYSLAAVTRDNRLPVGNSLAGVARHAGKVWTSYDFQQGSFLQGFGLGLGIYAEASRQATLPNSFKLPAYVRIDAAAWYRFTAEGRPLKAQLNIQNVTDRRIYDTDGANTLRATLPLTVLGSISAEF